MAERAPGPEIGREHPGRGPPGQPLSSAYLQAQLGTK